MQSRRYCCLILPTLLGGLMSSAALGQAIFTDRFDNPAQVAEWYAPDWPLGEAVLSHDPGMDAGGGGTPGALKVVANFQSASECQPGCNLIRLARNFGWRVNVTGKVLKLDLYVDPASAQRNGGDHGWIEWMLRYYVDDANNWVESNPKQAGSNLGGGATDGVWYHLEIPMSVFTHPLTDANAFEMQVWGGDTVWDNNMLIGQVTFWVDNVTLADADEPPPPATEPLILNRFNDAAELGQWRSETWTAGKLNLSFDPDMDAGFGGAKSGALKIEAVFDATNNCENTNGNGVCNMTWLVRDFASPQFLAGYGSLEMDIYVTAESARRGEGGDHGWADWRTRVGNNWETKGSDGFGMGNGGQIRGDTWNDGAWFHLIIPASGAGGFAAGGLNDVRALTMQIWGESAGAANVMDGTVTYWIDNVVWMPPPQPPKGYHVINDFNNADEVAAWTGNAAGNGAPTLIEFDPSQDANNDPNSGSMKLTIDFQDGTYNSEVQVQRELFPEPGVDFRDYSHFIARVKVAPDSPKTPWGNFGWSNWVFRNTGWSWNNAVSAGIPLAGQSGYDENGWFHYDFYFKTTDNPLRDTIRALTFQFGGLQTGRMVMWIDYIRMGRTRACVNPEQCELCTNLADDNGDGLTDCADPDCPGTLFCPIETACEDLVDDDGDGLIDCGDLDCAESTNCKHNDPFADIDNDGDVDQEDFGRFQLCYTGADSQLIIPGCGFLDRDSDLDVDLMDLEKFQTCASGPMLQADKDCDNPQ